MFAMSLERGTTTTNLFKIGNTLHNSEILKGPVKGKEK